MTRQYPIIYRRTCCLLVITFNFPAISMNENFRGIFQGIKLAGATPNRVTFRGCFWKFRRASPSVICGSPSPPPPPPAPASPVAYVICSRKLNPGKYFVYTCFWAIFHCRSLQAGIRIKPEWWVEAIFWKNLEVGSKFTPIQDWRQKFM